MSKSSASYTGFTGTPPFEDDEATCVRIRKLVEFYRSKRIGELEAQSTRAVDERGEVEL